MKPFLHLLLLLLTVLGVWVWTVVQAMRLGVSLAAPR
jgi:hypothetical protein